MRINYIAVLRDSIIVLFMSFVGGFVLGFMGLGDNFNILAIINLISISLGFLISGCLTKNERFKHLFIVAFVVWLVGLHNVILFDFPFVFWLFSIIPVLLSMGIGGGLSFLVARPDNTHESIVKD